MLNHPPASAARLHGGQLYGAARALAITEPTHPGLTLVITPNIASQRALEAECRFFLGADAHRLMPFPDWETLPYDVASPHSEIVSQRLHTLTRASSEGGLLIASVSTALQRLCPPAYLSTHTLSLACGQILEIDQLREQLQQAGYQTCSQVLAPGEYAVRGSVVDLFPMGEEQPCRLDFFDNCLDSIRLFEVRSQTSTGRIDAVCALPGREFPLTAPAITHFRKQFRQAFDIDPSHSSIYRDISEAVVPPGIEYYLPLFFEDTATLFDYLPEHTQVICWDDVVGASTEVLEQVAARFSDRKDDIERPPLPVSTLYLDEEELQQAIHSYPCRFLAQPKVEARESQATFNYGSQALPELRIRPQNQEPARALRRYLASAPRKVLFTVSSAGRREQLQARLSGLDLRVVAIEDWKTFCDQEIPFGLTVAELEDGFDLPQAGIAVIPEGRLFPDRAPQQHARSRRDPRAILSELANLQIGSPIVHEDYGVGRYQGLRKLDIDGIAHDFLYLQYADSDRLYVPVTELHRISRYSGAEPEQAPLHALGTAQWQKIKQKAAQRAYDVAAELLEVQARRAALHGCALPKPQAEYTSFADAFPFDPTPDQAAAIDEVLSDLQASTPMDRIVCGDVGFGKTEVGMRASFVAALNGFQSAVLTPTTLLAQQHHKTFSDRFADWPVRIESLSRFRTPRQQANILKKLAAGEIDVVIGTHRLLQGDVRFKNLGLIVVDEEQRFGVRHKEKLKALRARTNLLTLTATPIPRTLNMSLSGLRDLSIIATAPAHRYAIQTFINIWDPPQVREACLRELKRGGQIYIVHNRVRSINDTADRLRKLIPEAEIRVAHGQMRELELECVMRDFYRQRFNILVCTTIIESGIDVPNANTIIIDRADTFGLAQLHQLRGRVGRSHHLAYAYLTSPPLHTLTPEARKRIEAIESMEELGAGFTLATHDLEIRGAGELLGEEQSGQIQQVGFALYHRLLERAVRTLKEGGMPELDKPLEHGPEIDPGDVMLLPEDYIPDVFLRLMFYKRIASADQAAELEALQAEMIDRFGSLPEAAQNLFAVTRLKLEITLLEIRKIELTEQTGRITFNDAPLDPESLMKLIQSQPDIYRLDPRMRLNFQREMPSLSDRIEAVSEILGQITSPPPA